MIKWRRTLSRIVLAAAVAAAAGAEDVRRDGGLVDIRAGELNVASS